MSSSWLNIRFGTYHLQWDRGDWFPTFGHNPYQAELRRTDPNWRWFDAYEIKRPWL